MNVFRVKSTRSRLFVEYLFDMSVLVGEDEVNDKLRSSYSSEDAMSFLFNAGNGETQWCFSQVKGALDDDVTEGNSGRLIIFWREK